MADITRAKNLNPPRRDRTYPRVIKRARHNSYPGEKARRPRHPPRRPAMIKLVNLSPFSLAA
jgi:hypothetical protein